jgi:glycosyltransferase involved in cell wall biosynthesis
MPRTLFLTTELPYFPGQGGLMFLHIRHLSGAGMTGVVGPRYPHQPEDALQALRDTVARSYWWPEHPEPGVVPGLPRISTPTPRWVRLLPRSLKWQLLRRLTGLNQHSNDALAWRAVLVNLAPKFLEALGEEPWNALLLSQSLSSAWLPFLPASLARVVLFNDVRSDYLRRSPTVSVDNVCRTQREEKRMLQQVDAAAFISDLDLARAKRLLSPDCLTVVAPICLDLDYFSFVPPPTDSRPVLLFTGHLSHPPNVDAVLYFLSEIWPKVIAGRPDARFQIVGLQPAATVVAAVGRTPGVEMFADVPDIRPYFRSAKLYVVPMRYGGGVRQKILEAWALGLPVVTTTMGAEGLQAADGENCWLRDHPGDFAEQVVALLNAPQASGVNVRARSEVERRHSPSTCCPPLARLIESAVGRRRKTAPKVLFDLRWLEPGKVGGVEQMTYELIDELGAEDRSTEYRFWGPEHLFRRWRFAGDFKHRFIGTDGRETRQRAARDALTLQLCGDLGLPALVSPETQALELYTRLDFTVVHGLPSYIHPDLRRFPSVVTMHDLQHLHLPELFSADDIATREREYQESCRRATHIICTSGFTRDDVHRRYKLPLEKMSVVWNLPPRATATPLADATVRRLLRGMGIAPPFLLFPAQPWPHKNHAGLLKAWQQVLSEVPAELKLVMSGQPFPPGHPALALLAEPDLQRRVVHVGYRSPSEVAALYYSAEAMVFPSLFEGFGLPLLEAMQQRCPVVCGQHTSVPEVAGEAALYTDVSQPSALAEAIIRIIRDCGLRASLREAGTKNLLRFDRRQLAARTRAIYAQVHAQHFS